jgi:hypothetical protein
LKYDTPSAQWGNNYLKISNAMVLQAFTLGAGETISGWIKALNFSFAALGIAGEGKNFNWTSIGGSSAAARTNWSFTAENAWTYTLWFLSTGVRAKMDAVPIPASVYLLGAGLLGLYGIRRKFWKKQ